MIKNIVVLLLMNLVVFSAFSQEILTSPAYNPIVADQFKIPFKTKTATEALTLPFYDDFSEISVYPSPVRWADKYAFINTDFAKYPPSIGVATLDALNDKGLLYPNAGPNPFDADELTSLPIRLDSIFSPVKKALTTSDGVFLSFYYQPQGRSISAPSKSSSLNLEFHSPGQNDTSILANGEIIIEPRWNLVWSTEGGIQVDDFAKPDNKYFRQILIPINTVSDSSLYYKNGFQFRFRNIAALPANGVTSWRSNGSNWNIDVVLLKNGRNNNDTAINDIAFSDIAPSMLRNYESMPFKQYRNNFLNEMKDSLDIKIANLDAQTHSVSYKYDIRKNSGEPFSMYNGGSYPVEPFATHGYSNYNLFAKPAVNFFFPFTDEQKVVFHITHTLSTPDPISAYKTNDTIRFDQLFSNYYAYDNGSAEAGMGINGVGSYAVEFKLKVSDTLRGMQIYVNPTVSGTNLQTIDLAVWNDAFGKPGQIKQILKGVTPVITDNINELHTYWFETPVVIDPLSFPSMIFYIGWNQSFEGNLNVGFDRYKDSYSKRFFNVLGHWEMSDPLLYGSLIMRPIIGYKNPLGTDNPPAVQQLKIYPNPVTDGNLIVRLPESWEGTSDNSLEIQIVSASGSQVLSKALSSPVNVSALTPGFYIVILTDKKMGRKATAKLIIR